MKHLNDAEKDSWVNTLSLLSFNLYFMLEQYCISNNIKLYTFSWDASESDWNYKRASNKLMQEWGFKTFHNLCFYLFNCLYTLLYELNDIRSIFTKCRFKRIHRI